MPANPASEENELIEAALAGLRDTLPPNWKVEISNRQFAPEDPNRPAMRINTLVDVSSPQGVAASFLVEAKKSLMPRDAEGLFSGLARSYRILNPTTPVLAVAPWISHRAQEILTREGVNFLDLTGNVRIATINPPMFISAKGASRDPAPMVRGKARLRGPKAGRLIRLLADVAPPYGVSDMAEATGLTIGYVSRLLDALDEEALVERIRRGPVISTDVAGLLRRWTDSYDLLKSNRPATFVAPKGPANLLERLAETAPADVAITGSFAAVRLAPVAAPALLVAYCGDVDAVSRKFELLPADRGANVVLLRPFDPVVWERTITDAGLTYVATSQVAVDCLTGNGRMPAEGDALLTWMNKNEPLWRLPSLGVMRSENN